MTTETIAEGATTEKLYTIKEAAEMLKRPLSTIHYYIDRGELEVSQTGPKKRFRITETELERFRQAPRRMSYKNKYRGRELEILNAIKANGGSKYNHIIMTRFDAGDDIAWGRYVDKIANDFHFELPQQPGSSNADLKGGARQLWLRLHRERIVEYYEEYGQGATEWYFKIGTQALQKVLDDTLPKPFNIPVTRTDELELRVSCLHDEVRTLRSEVAETKKAFASFQGQVAGQIMRKFLIPLLQQGIELDETLYDANPGALGPLSLASIPERGIKP